MALSSAPNYAALQKETPAQQDTDLQNYFAQFGGTVTAAWVKNNPALAPYENMTALQMYNAVKTKFPKDSPLQWGGTVFQVWLVNGAGTAIQDITLATGTSLGAVAKGTILGAAQVVGDYQIKNPLAGIADFFQRLGEASTWERIGLFIGGGVLAYIGLKSAFGDTAAGRTVKDAATKAKSAAVKAGSVAAL
jgi:hypothetical protein